MVQGCLERMREVFEVCSGQADEIVAAVARHFRQLGQGPVRAEGEARKRGDDFFVGSVACFSLHRRSRFI